MPTKHPSGCQDSARLNPSPFYGYDIKTLIKGEFNFIIFGFLLMFTIVQNADFFLQFDAFKFQSSPLNVTRFSRVSGASYQHSGKAAT